MCKLGRRRRRVGSDANENENIKNVATDLELKAKNLRQDDDTVEVSGGHLECREWGWLHPDRALRGHAIARYRTGGAHHHPAEESCGRYWKSRWFYQGKAYLEGTYR